MIRYLAFALALLAGLPAEALAQAGAGPSSPGMAATTSVQIGCIYKTSLPTATNAQQQGVECDANGRIIVVPAGTLPGIFDVNVAAWGGTATTLGQKTMAASVPVVIASDQSNVPTNTVQLGGVAISKGNGTTDTGTQRVTISSDSTGTVAISQTTPGTTNGVTIAPTSASAAGITSVVSGSAEATHVLKASGGNLYSVYATNLTSTSGFLIVVNATSAPSDGAVTPLDCAPLPGNGFASISNLPGPMSVYSTGITAVLTSAVTCFTKTTGTITGFINGKVQ